MMKKLFIVIAMLFLLGCTLNVDNTKQPTSSASYYTGGDGSSFAQAVFFPNAKSSMDGVPLEKKWLAEKYPGYKMTRQAVIEENNRLYDSLEIVTASGETKTVYFDMTSWFGIPGLK
jgi:hypothetical protein